MMDRGLVEYRAGNYELAIKSLLEADKRQIATRSGRASAQLLLGMCHYRLARHEDARHWFSRATAEAREIKMPDLDILKDGDSYLVYEIIRREAAAMAPALVPTTRPAAGGTTAG
jgi:tetratricopeptide (TPR) repeat protein